MKAKLDDKVNRFRNEFAELIRALSGFHSDGEPSENLSIAIDGEFQLWDFQTDATPFVVTENLAPYRVTLAIDSNSKDRAFDLADDAIDQLLELIES